MVHGWPQESDVDLRAYKTRNLELTVEKGCVLWGHRLVIPGTLRAKFLGELYGAHRGIVKMKTLA